MANPLVVAIPTGGWTKVATSVQAGFIHLLKSRTWYFQTYRLTGVAAPTTLADAVRIQPSGMDITASVNIDVYVWAKFFAGSVRVDV